MANNILSVAVNFTENHRYRFPSDDPSSWIPVADPVRGPVKNKYIYVFRAIGYQPFELISACHALPDGSLIEVSAVDALKGSFPGNAGQATVGLGAPGQETRFFDTVQQQLVRYFFYVSRHVLDGSFLFDLARNPRPGLPIVTLDAMSAGSPTIPITDPLTVAEQLAIDYEKARKQYVGFCAPFEEQSDTEKAATADLLKKRLIATCLNQPAFASKVSSRLKTQPAEFLQTEDKKRTDAAEAREEAARHCILWLTGNLMGFARSTYGVDGPVGNWVTQTGELIKVEASAIARIADSYRGACHIRNLIKSQHYLMREFIGRPAGLNDSLGKVQQFAKDGWDVVSKLWISVGAVMTALASRVGTRAVEVNSVLTIQTLVTTYNTVFGDGTVTLQVSKLKPNFKWRDSISGNVRDVHLGDHLFMELNDGRVILLSKAQANSKNPFTLPHFAKGIALLNLALAVGAAYEALVNSNAVNPKQDSTMTVIKLLGAIVDTGGAFPQILASLIKATGRGVAFVGLAGSALSIATSFADARDALKSGDYNAGLGASITLAGGTLGLTGFAIVLANGGMVTFAAGVLGALGAALAILGTAIWALAKDSDLELLAGHVFLGKNFGDDSDQPSLLAAS